MAERFRPRAVRTEKRNIRGIMLSLRLKKEFDCFLPDFFPTTYKSIQVWDLQKDKELYFLNDWPSCVNFSSSVFPLGQREGNYVKPSSKITKLRLTFKPLQLDIAFNLSPFGITNEQYYVAGYWPLVLFQIILYLSLNRWS